MDYPHPAVAFYVSCLGSRRQPSLADALFFLDHFDLFIHHCRTYRDYSDEQVQSLHHQADEIRRLLR